MADNASPDPRIAALPDIHGHAKGEHKPYAEERPIPYTARMLFLWFFHACRRSSPRFVMVADHTNYLTFEDPAAVNLVRRALKLAQAGDLYGAAETAGVELGHAAVVSEGLRRGMRYSIGAEIDNDPRCRPDAQNIVDAMKPDGMIRSVHFLPIAHPQHGENWMWAFDNPEFKDLYDVVGTENVWEIYMATLLDAIEKLPGHIVGHFYVPAKFGHWPADDVLEGYEDRFLAACHERGMAIEVNSRYFYKYFVGDEAQLAKFRAVHLRLLRKAKALGVMVAVGSDAHSPKDQGGAFDAVLALLDEADINEIAFPIAGRLARVALRATEEILREHTAALAAVPERPAPRGAAAAASVNGAAEPREPGDEDDAEDEIDDDAPLIADEVPVTTVAAGSGAAEVAATTPLAAMGTSPVEAASGATAAPAVKKRAPKKSVDAVVATAPSAAHAVGETVASLVEKVAETAAAAPVAKNAKPTKRAAGVAPSVAEAVPAVATGALATVVAARAARSHEGTIALAAPAKSTASKAAKPKSVPENETTSTKAGAAKASAATKSSRSTKTAASATATAAKPTAAKAPAAAKPAAAKPTAAKASGSKAAAKTVPSRVAARAKASPAKATTGKSRTTKAVAAKSPAKGAAKAKVTSAKPASRGTVTKKATAKTKPSKTSATSKSKATAKKTARPSASAKKSAPKPAARKAAKPSRPAAKPAAKKTAKPVARAARKSVAKKPPAKKSPAKSKTSRARR